MAIIRISNAGGLFSSTGTWDGGAIPTTADTIRGDSLSGALTVDSNRTILGVDLAGYIRRFTISNGVTLIINGTGITSTFSTAFTSTGGYDFGTTGQITRSNNHQIAWAGNPNRTSPHGPSGSLPRFFNNATFVYTATTNFYFQNLSGSSEMTINGTYSTFITGNLTMSSPLTRFNGTQPYIMTGTGSLQGNLASITNAGPGTLILNTPGTITIGSYPNATFYIGANRSEPSPLTFMHIAGSVSNPNFVLKPNYTTTTNGTIILGLTSGTPWKAYADLTLGGSGTKNPLSFSGSCQFDNFSFFAASNNSNTSTIFNVDLSQQNPTTTISIGDLILDAAYHQGLANQYLTKTYFTYLISPTMSLLVNGSIDANAGNNLPFIGGSPSIVLRSSVPGTTASFRLNTYNQYVSKTGFVDIDCSSGNTLYGQSMSLSNTYNISNYTLPPTTGGGGPVAYTFVN